VLDSLQIVSRQHRFHPGERACAASVGTTRDIVSLPSSVPRGCLSARSKATWAIPRSR
jgi:hypothetical protein